MKGIFGMEKRSLLPWHLQSGEIADCNGEFVASLEGELPTGREAANAALILRAVNNHSALLEACKSADAFFAIFKQESESAFGNWNERWKTVRSAIAAAESEVI